LGKKGLPAGWTAALGACGCLGKERVGERAGGTACTARCGRADSGDVATRPGSGATILF
jgi:hypothetical protein